MKTLQPHQSSFADHVPGLLGPARKPSATILVSHASALVAAGLLATLRRLPECALELWDGTQGPWHLAPMLGGVDLVVADAESFAPVGPSANEEAAPRHAAAVPRVVLIATRPGADPILVPRGADACLPIGCREEELFVMVRQLTCVSTREETLDPAIWHRQESKPLPATVAGAVRRPSGGLAPGALRRVREHVEAHLAERIGLGELAAIARLSECHFSRAFKQSVGIPPHRYIMTRRVAAAARLIQASDRPLTEISLAVGFSDQSHFTRVFVDVMDETPRDFRRRHR